MSNQKSKPAARLGDIASGHGCFPPTAITTGSSKVKIDGRPAARVGDSLEAHGCDDCPPHNRTIVLGSKNVIIDGRPAAIVGSAIDCGGNVTSGSSMVKIGGELVPFYEHADGTYVRVPEKDLKTEPVQTAINALREGGNNRPDNYYANQASQSHYADPYNPSPYYRTEEPFINTKTFPDRQVRKILDDNHEAVMLLTLDEAFLLHEWARNHWSSHYDKEAYQLTYNALKDYTIHAKDAYHLSVLAKGFNSIGARAYLQVVGDKTYMVFKGYAGIRKVLPGITRLPTGDPRILQLGLGKLGIKNAVQTGTVLSIVVISAFRVGDYALRDDATMAQLLGGLGIDFAKLGISAGISYAIGSMFAGGMTTAAIGGGAAIAGSFVLGPLIVVLVVGVGATTLLNIIDDSFEIEEKLVEFIERAQQEAAQIASRLSEPEKLFWDVLAAYLDGVLETGKEVLESEMKKYLRNKVNELLGHGIR